MFFAYLQIHLISSLQLATQQDLSSCECKPEKIGDLFCHKDCNTQECNFDGGDCDGDICYCESSRLGDGICDWECTSFACGWDLGDCCENWMLYNGFCDAACYLERFNFDNQDCARPLTACKCMWETVGDDVCKFECSDHPECLNDLGDCCFDFEIGDGHCEEYCYSPVNNWDGGDCFVDPPVDCACWEDGILGDGVCDEQCRTEECWYDMGDCCTDEMLGDGECDPECNDEQHAFDEGDCN